MPYTSLESSMGMQQNILCYAESRTKQRESMILIDNTDSPLFDFFNNIILKFNIPNYSLICFTPIYRIIFLRKDKILVLFHHILFCTAFISKLFKNNVFLQKSLLTKTNICRIT